MATFRLCVHAHGIQSCRGVRTYSRREINRPSAGYNININLEAGTMACASHRPFHHKPKRHQPTPRVSPTEKYFIASDIKNNNFYVTAFSEYFFSRLRVFLQTTHHFLRQSNFFITKLIPKIYKFYKYKFVIALKKVRTIF